MQQLSTLVQQLKAAKDALDGEASNFLEELDQRVKRIEEWVKEHGPVHTVYGPGEKRSEVGELPLLREACQSLSPETPQRDGEVPDPPRQ